MINWNSLLIYSNFILCSPSPCASSLQRTDGRIGKRFDVAAKDHAHCVANSAYHASSMQNIVAAVFLPLGTLTLTLTNISTSMVLANLMH